MPKINQTYELEKSVTSFWHQNTSNAVLVVDTEFLYPVAENLIYSTYIFVASWSGSLLRHIFDSLPAKIIYKDCPAHTWHGVNDDMRRVASITIRPLMSPCFVMLAYTLDVVQQQSEGVSSLLPEDTCVSSDTPRCFCLSLSGAQLFRAAVQRHQTGMFFCIRKSSTAIRTVAADAWSSDISN